MKFGQNQTVVLGILAAYGNCKAFFMLELWAGSGMIEESLGKKTPEEAAIFQKKRTLVYTAAKIIFSLGISVFSQLPFALPAADHASSDSKVVAGVITLISSLIIPARSLQLSIDKALAEIFQSKTTSLPAMRSSAIFSSSS